MKRSIFKLTGLITAVFLLIVFSSIDAYCASTAEREALIALYNSTDGPNWFDDTGWLEAETECTWYGVTCQDSKVIRINLYSNNLKGSIPPEIGNLASLTGLWLDSNQLSGSIPPEIGNLASLTSLWLDSNQLSGSIPPEIGNLASLTVLWLDYNQLSGSIPPEIGNLASLTGLYLDSNQLSGSIPPEI